MTAGELPVELLAKVLAHAVGAPCARYYSINLDWRSLKTLCTARAVSRDFRAGVDLALQSLHELELREGDALPLGLLDSPQARLAKRLSVLQDEDAALSRSPALRRFVERCPELYQAYLRTSNPANAAFLDSAFCCSPGLGSYWVHGHVPRQLPRQVCELRVQPGAEDAEGALELCLIHAQQCADLECIELFWRQPDGEPLCIKLHASQLAGLQLPALQYLDLQLFCFDADGSDLSFLGQPRTFAVGLRLRDQELAPAEERLAVLQRSCSAPQTT